MIVKNEQRDTVLGEAIEVADTAVRRVKGLLGRECLEEGQGLLFKKCSSLHTLFMRFPIDIIFLDKHGKVLKVSKSVKPFKIVAAPLRSYYALEVPENTIALTGTRIGDQLAFEEERIMAISA